MGEDTTSFWTDIKQYEGVLERDPDSYAFIPLSSLYRKLGLFDDALAVAQRGCSRHPNLVGGQLVLGLACHELGLKHDCRTALENVVRVTPENMEAQRILSRMYADAGEQSAAKSALKIILSLAPNDLESQVIQDAITRVGGALSDKEDAVEAGIEFDEEASPTVAVAVEEGGLEFETEDEEILDLDDACIIEDLGEIEEEEAPEPALDEAVADQAPLVSATMAELYVKQGFNDLAIGIYRQLVAANPIDTGLLTRLDQLLAAERAVSPAPMPDRLEFDALQPYDSVCIADAPAETVSPRMETVAVLEGWLENIRRVKACRSSLH